MLIGVNDGKEPVRACHDWQAVGQRILWLASVLGGKRSLGNQRLALRSGRAESKILFSSGRDIANKTVSFLA